MKKMQEWRILVLVMMLGMSPALWAQADEVMIKGAVDASEIKPTERLQITFGGALLSPNGQKDSILFSGKVAHPKPMEILVISKSGKIVVNKRLWAGPGTYQLQGSLTEPSSLGLWPEHPYQPIQRALEGPFSKETADLIAEHFDKEVVQTWLASRVPFLSADALTTILGKLSEEQRSHQTGLRILSRIEDSRLPAPKVGDPMRDFQAEDKEGNTVSISDFAGKYLLLDFSSAGCVPCLLAFPELAEIRKEHGDELAVVSVWNDKTREIWINWAANHKEQITWVDLWDSVGVGFNKYKIDQYPVYYFINPQGQIVDVMKGYRQGKLKKMVRQAQ
jgi:thiol-disulfide isomerase/thioredoxin